MKTSFLTFCLVASTLSAVEPPKNYNNSRYYHLFQRSIVTDKPEPIVEEEVKNDLEDWVLVGSRKSPTSQAVTIVNTKDQSQRIAIPSKEATDLGFAILELKQDPGNFTRTEAHLRKGSFKGWVKYDQKFLTVKKAKPRQANNRKPNQRPKVKRAAQNKPPIPGLPGANNASAKKTTNKRKPRVRYVPKPKK